MVEYRRCAAGTKWSGTRSDVYFLPSFLVCDGCFLFPVPHLSPCSLVLLLSILLPLSASCSLFRAINNRCSTFAEVIGFCEGHDSAVYMRLRDPASQTRRCTFSLSLSLSLFSFVFASCIFLTFTIIPLISLLSLCACITQAIPYIDRWIQRET